MITGRVAAALSAGLLCGSGCNWLGAQGAAGERVPTFEVQEAPFVRTVTAEGVLKPVKTTVLSAPTDGPEVLMIAWMADDGTPVKQGDVVVRFDPTEAVRWLENGKGEREAAMRRIEKEKTASSSALHERDRVATVTREELDNARKLGKKDPRFFPRSEVVESELDEEIYQARLTHAGAVKKVEQRLAQSKLELLSVDQTSAEARTKAARAALSALELRAPHDGTFVVERGNSRTGTLKTGNRVYQGMRLGEIGSSDQTSAEIYVLEGDAGGLQVGKQATVVLEARPDVTLKAKVSRVSPFPKSLFAEMPTQYFTTALTIEGSTAGLKPGQRLHATLVLDRQDNALVVPRHAVFRRNDELVVFRQKGSNDFETVKVRLGVGTVGRVVVADGVKAGDRIALRDPGQSVDEMMATPARGGARGSASAGPRREIRQNAL